MERRNYANTKLKPKVQQINITNLNNMLRELKKEHQTY